MKVAQIYIDSLSAIEFPQSERSDLFYPEMEQQRNPTKPILGEYIYNAYDIKWSAIRSVEMGIKTQG